MAAFGTCGSFVLRDIRPRDGGDTGTYGCAGARRKRHAIAVIFLSTKTYVSNVDVWRVFAFSKFTPAVLHTHACAKNYTTGYECIK